MRPTVIDTLRYANRLKQAGVETGQAEAMSRALNAELTEGLVTKTDLGNAVSELGGQIDALDAKFEIRFAAVDSRFAEMGGKFEAVDAKIDALRSQNRYVFLVLALIAGLGLYNATAPHFLGRVGQAPSTQPMHSAPTAQATVPETGATTAAVG